MIFSKTKPSKIFLSKFLLLIACIFLLTNISAQYISRNNSIGYWSDSRTWVGMITPGVSVTDTDIQCYGEVIALNCLTFDKGTLYIHDTLIINGNLDLLNNARLEIAENAVLFIFGDYESKNMVEVLNKGTLFVAGNFSMLGSDNQGYFKNSGVGEVFILDPTPEIKGGSLYADLECSDPNKYPQKCGYGKLTDFKKHSTYSYYTSTPYSERIINPEGNACSMLDFVVNTKMECINKEIEFTLISIGITASDSLIWEFGGGSFPKTGYGFGPHLVKYHSAGSKTVILKKVGGEQVVRKDLITIETCNDFDFVSNKSEACKNEKISFKSFAVNNIGLVPTDSFAWNFGDGAIPKIAYGPGEHEVYYTSVGKKDVSLTIPGDTTIFKTGIVEIKECIGLDIISDKNFACHGEVFTFNLIGVTSATGDSLIWNFGEGAMPMVAKGTGDQKVFYKTKGPKTISLEIVGDTTILKIGLVEVMNCRKIEFESDKQTSCIGDTIVFTSFTENILDSDYLIWGFDKGATPLAYSGSGPYSVVYDSPGGKNITLDVPNTDSYLKKLAYIKVSTCNQLSFVANKTKACLGDTIIFENQTPDLEDFDTLIWNFGNDASPSVASGKGPLKVVYGAAGDKDVSLALKNNLVSPVVRKSYIKLDSPPKTGEISLAGFPETNSDEYFDEVCEKTKRIYKVTGDENSSYLWSIPSIMNEIKSKNEFEINWDVSVGEHILRVQEVSELGCLGSISDVTIKVKSCIEPSIFTTTTYTFTPNDDGSNEIWIIEGIEDYPQAKVYVFDRFGRKVFVSKGGYNNDWNGKLKGSTLPLNSYYFLIDFTAYDKEPVRGIITLLK